MRVLSDRNPRSRQHVPNLTFYVFLPEKGAFPRHIGRTKGGLNSRFHAVCDDEDRPVRLYLTAGRVSDFKAGDVLLADLSDKTGKVTRDRRYNSSRVRQSLAGQNITACISGRARTGNQSRFTTGTSMKSAA
ncbi:MAG: transposase [Komagataeibacter hansenii]|nr:transposase [Novacetimonas hansenii]